MTLIVDIASMPAWVLAVPPVFIYPTLYWRASPHFRTEKQRAYIMSTFSSGCMSLMALPFVRDYSVYGLEGMFAMAQEGWRRELGRIGAVSFGVYLFMDLALGYFKYRTQIGVLTGWVHHTVYIALMFHLLNTKQTPMFMTGAIMEVPTFDLAISNLFPAVRNDLRFLTTFFLLRIVLNAVFLVDAARPAGRVVTDNSWVPTVMLSLAFAMHTTWFKGGVTGYVKRQRKARAKASPSETVGLLQDAEPIETAEQGELDTSPGLVCRPSPTTNAGNLVETDTVSPTRTPDDSPLVTPYTPSITPMSIRDSYILPALPSLKLPALHMPALPHIPQIPHIPSLSDLTTAAWQKGGADIGQFKDAVRNRWEEQRERFTVGAKATDINSGGINVRRRTGRIADGTTVTVREVGVRA